MEAHHAAEKQVDRQPRATTAPSPAGVVRKPAHPVLMLQHSVGNLAVQHLLQAGPIQPRLAAGPPPAELYGPQRLPDAAMSGLPGIVQRKCACGASNGSSGQCEECRKKQEEDAQTAPAIAQRRAAYDSEISEAPTSLTEAVYSAGQPLDTSTRAFMEQRFGQDFGDVRVHTDAAASQSASALGANAFTTGQSIFFAAGQYAPRSRDGQHLLAHELVHTIQQRDGAAARGAAMQAGAAITVAPPDSPQEQEAEAVATQVTSRPVVLPLASAASPEGDQFQPSLGHWAGRGSRPLINRDEKAEEQAEKPDPAIEKAVNTIIDALVGVTTRGDSARILEQFQGKDAATVRAIMQGVKAQAGKHGKSQEAMIDWLFEDMTAEDSRTLRQTLIKIGVLDDIARIVAHQVQDLLKGYTSESDSQEIYQALAEFAGPKLDTVLAELEKATGKGQGDMAEWLFGDMDRTNAERLRQYFFANSGRALGYAVIWTASKIHSLLSGYVSHSDSSSIAWNFKTTPQEYRIWVLQRLNELTGGSVEGTLMDSMDKSDYEELRSIGGLTLKPYEDRRSTLTKVVSGAEWAMVVAEWIVCGVIGIITGILSSVWEIIKGLWDIVLAAKNLLWSLVYLVSGGAAGSENWLAVKDFFRGLKALGSPGKLWDQYWDNLGTELKTIEGPLTDCRQAEFIVRQFINAVVNIILIFAAGYGLAKGAVSIVRGIGEFAELASEVGYLRALVKVGAGAGKAIGKFVSKTAGEVAELLEALGTPVQTLARIGRRINLILAAVDNEGVWGFLRAQGRPLLESERKFWKNEKDPWHTRAEALQGRHGELSDEATSLFDGLNEDQPKAPEQATQVVQDLANDSTNLDQDVSALNDEMTKPVPEPGEAEPAGGTDKRELVTSEGEELVGPTEGRTLTEKVRKPENVRPVFDPELGAQGFDYEVEVEGHMYRHRADGTWCRFSPVKCGFYFGADVESAIEAVGRRATRPPWRASERYVEELLGDDWEPQVSYFEGKRSTPDKYGSSKPDLYNRRLNIAAEVKNYDIANEYDALVQKLIDQAGARISNMPPGVRQWVFIDVRGQKITDFVELAGRIRKDTRVFESIHFITEAGVVTY